MTKKTHIENLRLKPVGEEGIQQIRAIVKSGAAKVNEVFVDSFSASAVIGVYDRLSTEAQVKFRTMPIAMACDISFKVLNRCGRVT